MNPVSRMNPTFRDRRKTRDSDELVIGARATSIPQIEVSGQTVTGKS